MINKSAVGLIGLMSQPLLARQHYGTQHIVLNLFVALVTSVMVIKGPFRYP